MIPSDFKKHPMKFPKPFVYRGYCVQVTDGDTIVALIDCGLNEYVYRNIRFKGVDTPEIFKPKTEKELVEGLNAKQLVQDKLLNKPIKLITNEGVSFDRVVAEVYYFDFLNQIWCNIAVDLIKENMNVNHS